MAIDPNMNFLSIHNPQHDTEILIRAINRRLESYGKHMYHPDYLEEGRIAHLQQYDDLVARIHSVVGDIPAPLKGLPNGKAVKINIMGYKGYKGKSKEVVESIKQGRTDLTAGRYLQISRSKEVISALTPYLNELKTIVEQTPTWQELMKSMSKQAGRKLSRKEAIKDIEDASDILRLSDFKLFLAESEGVFEDAELTDILKPFRSASKGGTRPANADKVSDDDLDALKAYLYDYRQNNYSNALAGRVITPYMPSSDVDIDDYSRSKGRTKK